MTKPTRPLAHTLLALTTLLGCGSDDPVDPGQDSEWAVVLSDDFNRADGGYGGAWDFQIFSTTGEAGSAMVSGNRLTVSGGEFYALRHLTEVGGDSIRVSAVCATMAGEYQTLAPLITPSGLTVDVPSGCGVVAKSRDLGENWRFQEAYGAFIYVVSNTVAILRFQGEGAGMQLASGSYAVGPQESHRITLSVEGNRVTMRVEPMAGGTATTLTAVDPQPLTVGGIVSLVGAQGVNDVIFFDDFLVERRE